MEVPYKIIAFIYDLMDVLYFKKGIKNPREQLINCITLESPNVLEISIGTASNSIALSRKKVKALIDGIDLSDQMINMALKKISKECINNINIIKGNATNLPFKEQEYDVVIISLLLHEIDDEARKKVLQEAYRVLKDNGKLLILEWEKQNGFRNIMFSIIRILEPKGFEEFLNIDIEKYYRENRFRVVKKISCNYSMVLELGKLV